METSDTVQRESRSVRDKVLTAVAAATSLYTILYITHSLSRLGIIIYLHVYLASILMIALVLVFVLYRARRGDVSSRIPWYDYLFMAASLVSMGYVVFNYEAVI